MTAIHAKARFTRTAIATGLLLLGAAAQPAFARDRTSDGDKPAAARAKPSEKARPVVYCVKEVPTGSLLMHKTCKSREEWIALTGVDPAKL